MTVAVALGSNLGDRRAAILSAAGLIARFVDDVVVSATVETTPVGAGTEGQPSYLNAALRGVTALSPRQLLEELLRIELAFGRTRPARWAPRTLDLDLILFGDWVIEEPGLQVPHPRFRERLFVLEPLAEIAPELRDPVTGLTVGELLRAARARQ